MVESNYDVGFADDGSVVIQSKKVPMGTEKPVWPVEPIETPVEVEGGAE